MANLTLNQIVAGIKAYGESHAQIKTVKFRAPVDSLDSGDLRYPAFLFDYSGGRKEGSELVMRFKAWVLDLLLKEAENETEVWSDTQMIATDLLALLDDSDNWSLTDGIDIEMLRNAEPDLLAGVTFDFTLRVPFPYDRCLVPGAETTGDFNHDFNLDFDGGVEGPDSDFNQDFNTDFNQ